MHRTRPPATTDRRAGCLSADRNPADRARYHSRMLSKAEEDRLIRRAQRGDGEAIEALIRAHQSALYGYLLRLCHRPEVAEDIAQEALVRVLRHLDRFDPRFRFSTWLFTIARRLWVNHSQKACATADSESAESWIDAEPRPEELLVAVERKARLRRVLDVAVSCLSPIQQEIVTLFHHHAWTIEALSSHLSIPEGTIKSHLHRARKQMRQVIADDAQLARDAEEALR